MRKIGMGKGRAPACEKHRLRKGSWTDAEDTKLVTYILRHGHGNWRSLPKLAGLLRCGKSCRLRWMNYLRPDIKRGNFSKEEEDTVIRLHQLLGNKWSIIASRLPGRTDNEIKNVWNTHLKKRPISISPSSASSETCNPTNNIECDITVHEINNCLEMEGDGIPDVDGMDVFEFPSEIMRDDVDRWANINMIEDGNHFNYCIGDRDQGGNNKNFAPIQQPYKSSELMEDNPNAWWIQYLERELDLVDSNNQISVINDHSSQQLAVLSQSPHLFQQKEDFTFDHVIQPAIEDTEPEPKQATRLHIVITEKLQDKQMSDSKVDLVNN